MAKTTFIDGNKSTGVLGTRVLAAFLNKIFAHRHANVDADGNSSLDYATATGSSNAYAVTLPLDMTALLEGVPIAFKANHTNTGACTLNVNGLGAVAMVRGGSTALAAGNIRSGQIVTVAYDGTSFQVLSLTEDIITNSDLSSSPSANKAAKFNGSGIMEGAELKMTGEASATSDTDTTTLDLGTVTSGDRIFVSARVYVNGSETDGTYIFYVAKSSGTATIQFFHDISDIRTSIPGCRSIGHLAVSGVCKITGSGTLVLQSHATAYSETPDGYEDNQIYAFFLKKQA